MRLWSLHPRYLDTRGLVALWREALLAKAVLCMRTRGYRHHPQLARFRAHAMPRLAINAYLAQVHAESLRRGYRFDRSKVGPVRDITPICVTAGQIGYEWQHLQRKLLQRDPGWQRQLAEVVTPDCHPLFRVRPGPIESWEIVTPS